MKAIVYTRYGSPDVLQVKEVEKPVPEDDEVLITQVSEFKSTKLNAFTRAPVPS